MKTLMILFMPCLAFGICRPEEVINRLRPGASWIMKDGDVRTIQWTDAVQTKPTLAEYTLELSACNADETSRKAQKQQARLDVKNTSLTTNQRIQALMILLDLDL